MIFGRFSKNKKAIPFRMASALYLKTINLPFLLMKLLIYRS